MSTVVPPFQTHQSSHSTILALDHPGSSPILSTSSTFLFDGRFPCSTVHSLRFISTNILTRPRPISVSTSTIWFIHFDQHSKGTSTHRLSTNIPVSLQLSILSTKLFTVDQNPSDPLKIHSILDRLDLILHQPTQQTLSSTLINLDIVD